MKRQTKRFAVIALTTTAITLLLGLFTYSRIEQPVPFSQLKMTVAKMPLGITAEEADTIMGAPPDLVAKQDGVLVTSVTMLTASNELAKKHGSPQTYSMRIWKRDGIEATVAVNSDGMVAGRWTWHPADLETL